MTSSLLAINADVLLDLRITVYHGKTQKAPRDSPEVKVFSVADAYVTSSPWCWIYRSSCH